MIITIDGPGGAGKSSVSRIVAKRLKALYLDTGALYRAVALQALREETDLEDAQELGCLCRRMDLHLKTEGENNKVFLGMEDVSLAIRSPEMDMLSSKISAGKEVREAMLELQRRIGNSETVVAEGRDMGTVVFPDADYKFFVTASTEVRAERRYKERLSRGESVSREDVERDLIRRDTQDMTRPVAPLRPAADAIVIDTSEITLDQVIEAILGKIRGEKGEENLKQ